MKHGIYTITNTKNSKIYLGCTTDFYKRNHQHFRELRLGTHKNQHLQSAFNKYGEGVFVFEILLTCPKEQLTSEEHYWANLLKVHDKRYGYNHRPTHPYGMIIKTPEIIEKHRQKMLGRKLSKESIEKRTATRRKNARVKGYYHSDSTKKLMAQKRSSYKISEETKEKIRKTLKGRKLSTEHIENAVQGRKGYKHSKETKNKIGNANRKIRI